MGVPWSKRTRLAVGSGDRHYQSLFCVPKHGQHLLPRYAWEPFKKHFHSGSPLQVLEQGSDWNVGAAKNPRSAHLAKCSFYRGALAPIQHA